VDHANLTKFISSRPVFCDSSHKWLLCERSTGTWFILATVQNNKEADCTHNSSGLRSYEVRLLTYFKLPQFLLMQRLKNRR